MGLRFGELQHLAILREKGSSNKKRSDVTVGKLVWARLFWIADNQASFRSDAGDCCTSKPLRPECRR